MLGRNPEEKTCGKTVRNFFFQIGCYVKNNTGWILQTGALWGGSLYSAVTRGIEMTSSQGLPFGTAQASAAITEIMVPATVYFALRETNDAIQKTHWGRHVGLGARISSHKMCSYILSAASLTHTGAHIWVNRDNFLKPVGITGLNMIGAFVFPLAGTYILRQFKVCLGKISWGNFFLRPHQLGALFFLINYTLHAPNSFWYGLVPLLSYTLDVFRRAGIRTDFAKTIYQQRVPGTNWCEFTITCPSNFKISLPGDYALLSLRSSCDPPRPFTIANQSIGNKRFLTFFFKTVGPGTQDLANRIDRNEDITWKISGPYISKLSSAYRKTKLYAYTMGSGLTYTLALINAAKNETSLLTSLFLYVSLARWEEALMIVNALKDIEATHKISSLTIYLTQEKNHDVFVRKLSDEGYVFNQIDNKNEIEFFSPYYSNHNVAIRMEELPDAQLPVDHPVLSLAPSSPDMKTLDIPFSPVIGSGFFKINIVTGIRMKVGKLIENIHPEGTVAFCGNEQFRSEGMKAARQFGIRCLDETF